MCADSIKFKKIEKENLTGDDDFNLAMESIRNAEQQGGMESQVHYGVKEKTYTVTRKNLIIIGVVVLIIVMLLFVISAIVGHYTAKNSQIHSLPDGLHQKWSDWSKWTRCSVSCGIGTKRRVRSCELDDPYTCPGRNDDVMICVMDECNDDKWSTWSAWSQCSKMSGECKKSRERSCHNTALNIGGGRCTGSISEDKKCYKEACYGWSWTEWGEWSECSNHCDFGVMTRTRVCQDHRGNKGNTTNCSGQSVLKKWCHNIACEDADECLSNPCAHGTCVDKYKEYTCVCKLGWVGKNCEVLDHCSSSPCVYGNCTSQDQGYNCTCIGSMGPRCEVPLADCVDIRDAGFTVSGIYTILLEATNEHVQVYCDMETAGGGWTVFQNRFDGSVNFFRNFSDYEYGFGDLNGEFWLGLHYMYHLSTQLTELRIDLEAADTTEAYETFQSFSLSSGPYYTLSVSSPSGISPSSKGLMYNNGESFSTFDKERSGNNCAEKDRGGWWFDNCAYANLNGFYGTPGSTVGYNGRQEAAMTYRSFKGYESLKASKMMIRRKQ